jgi:hypothetical protein
VNEVASSSSLQGHTHISAATHVFRSLPTTQQLHKELALHWSCNHSLRSHIEFDSNIDATLTTSDVNHQLSSEISPVDGVVEMYEQPQMWRQGSSPQLLTYKNRHCTSSPAHSMYGWKSIMCTVEIRETIQNVMFYSCCR